MREQLRKRGGENLRAIREMRGLTCKQLADRVAERYGIQIGADSICKYERGTVPVAADMVAIFAACLDCSVATLMDGMDLNQPRSETVQELRMLSRDSHETFHWVATKWRGDADALITAFGAYAATPGRYRKYAMMELLVQIDRAIRDGSMKKEDIPPSVLRGLPHVEELLGGLYEDK